MSFDPKERLNKILKCVGISLLVALAVGLFGLRLFQANRRAEAAESELAAIRMLASKTTPSRVSPSAAQSATSLQADPDAITRSKLIGRWVNHGVHDGHDCVRTLTFEQSGKGEFKMNYPGAADRVGLTENGPWGVQGDIFYIEVKGEDVDAHYVRIIRLTSEKLAIRNAVGTERVYDRVK
jgi:hypothetical protein